MKPADVVRAVAGPDAILERYAVASIPHRVIRETTAGLERMTLVYRTTPNDARVREATVVVKRMRADAASGDPHLERFMPSRARAHPNFWRREYDAYGDAVLRDLPAPLRAPRCYARACDEGAATLWLEDVAAEPAADWTDDRFHAVARAFGAWRVANDRPWFARGSLRMWAPDATSLAYAALHDESSWLSPRVAAAFGRHALEPAREAWRARDAWLDALERGPQTLCHNDLWTRNLLASPAAADVVAIDWSELGYGPVANDLVNLVLDSVWMFDVPASRLAGIERAVVDGYGAGRAESGAAAIEASYRTNARLRFGLLAGALVAQAARPDKRVELELRYERPFDEIFDTRAAVVRAALGDTDASLLK